MSSYTAYEIGQAELAPLALNGIYHIIRSSFNKENLKSINLAERDKEDINKTLSVLYDSNKSATVYPIFLDKTNGKHHLFKVPTKKQQELVA